MVRRRDYAAGGDVGRDYTGAEAVGRGRVLGGETSGLHLEGEAYVYLYAGQDELYYDSAELVLHTPWRRRAGSWDLGVGPAVRFLRDLDGGNRDYVQTTGRGSLGRLLSGAGFGEVSLEAGYRDYRGEGSQVIEVTSLSASLLRSDYWLVDLLVLGNVPVVGGVSLDLLASSSWEVHPGESERIQITFVTLGVSRAF
jgi:hypothetical protein